MDPEELTWIMSKFSGEYAQQLVNQTEFADWMKKVGFVLSKGVLAVMYQLANVAKADKVPLGNFAPIVTIILDTEEVEEILFQVADLDKSGTIDVEEFAELKQRMGWSVELPKETITKETFKGLAKAIIAEEEAKK